MKFLLLSVLCLTVQFSIYADNKSKITDSTEYVTLKSENSFAKINTLGAEVKVFSVNKDNIIWQSNPKYWTGSAPVLFPIIGKLKNGEYLYNGKTYKLPIHGFASISNFSIKNKTKNCVTLELKSSAETKKIYPFDFNFTITFSINQNILNVKYKIINCGKDAMYFSLGSHPAINLPLKNTELNDYYIEFEKNETLTPYLRDKQSQGLLKRDSKPFINNEKVIKLNEKTFSAYPLEFTDLKSRNIYIKNNKTGRNIKINIQNAPDLGIWAVRGANYVCIEPWFGHDDTVNVSGKLEEKPGILSLAPEKTFETGYSIQAVKL